MTAQPASNSPQGSAPASARLKLLPFAFPFLRKGQGQSQLNARFTDEREIYRLLAGREMGGGYLVSAAGLWHGGIHVSEAGAGQSLDLDAGLRCIADGVLIAFRANRTYPVSELTPAGGTAAVQAPYSTGFALVRHTMEFPQGAKLTFYSLYMHLMSWDDYANFPKREKPSYWSRQWRVAQHAQNKPSAGRNGQVANPSQQGLRVRKSASHGEVTGILPQGASVSIGRKEKGWGQVTEMHGASLYPPTADGYVEPTNAVGGWIYLGQDNGEPVVEEFVPDSMFDRVIVTRGIPIKAGDLIGHLGRYDSLNQGTSGTRMAHIEVFCDDSIQSFLERGRAWVNQHGPHKEDWAALGQPSEPTLLRIAPGTVLYQRTGDDRFIPGAEPQSRKTDAVQVYSLAELARDPNRRVREPHPSPDPGYPVNWWHVEGVNALGQPIDGWVCDFNHASGRVTREFAQKWIDFECVADAHDPAHTIFATTQGWVDYAGGASVADPASRSKLSPLMLKVYDALFTKGDGRQAADELCTLSQAGRDGYPWLMQAASRLIVKHESEWANPSKWKQLIAALEQESGEEGRAQHEAEQERIERLVWWDEVRAGVTGFPGPEVYHINPVAIVGNFIKLKRDVAKLMREIGDIISGGEGGYESYNTGTKNVPGGAVGHSYLNPPAGTVTGKTINEIIATDVLSGTDVNRFFATGKYQTVIETLRLAKIAMNLTGGEKYDVDMQEKIFREYLIGKAGGGALMRFVRDGQGTVDEAQYAAAKEWASIAVPSGMTLKNGNISNGTSSYYQSSANSTIMSSTNKLKVRLKKISIYGD